MEPPPPLTISNVEAPDGAFQLAHFTGGSEKQHSTPPRPRNQGVPYEDVTSPATPKTKASRPRPCQEYLHERRLLVERK